MRHWTVNVMKKTTDLFEVEAKTKAEAIEKALEMAATEILIEMPDKVEVIDVVEDVPAPAA